MNKEIERYNNSQSSEINQLFNLLANTIDIELTGAESKIWHAHPVWFIEGNPIVGYSKQKAGIKLMFWSGADFEEVKLNLRGSSFKDASILYNSISDVNIKDLKRWLKKSKAIQWDYKNIVKRKGKLELLKGNIELTTNKKKSPYGKVKFNTIDEYHQTFSVSIQQKLNQLRSNIIQAAPQTKEGISYNMPAFKLHTVLVYYAVHKEHIGFYPTPTPITFFKQELSSYSTSKGAIQFPLNKPLPLALIKKIVKFRVHEDIEKMESKKRKSNQQK
jgi:uncharacterized protein YdhG (YjbR/CyaY superfamily)